MDIGAHTAAPPQAADDVQDDVAAREGAAAALAQDIGQQDNEGLSMLLVGFGTGITIAMVFLLYILLEAAHLLP